jgi:hypothetical protein
MTRVLLRTAMAQTLGWLIIGLTKEIATAGRLACNAEITFRLVEFPSPEYRVSMEKVAAAIALPVEALAHG